MTFPTPFDGSEVLTAAGLKTHAAAGIHRYYVSDGERIYTTVQTEDGESFEVPHYTNYPESVNYLFGDELDKKSQLNAEALDELWQLLGDETEALGYARGLTAAAMVLYHEGAMMRQMHYGRHEYTLADCLKIITTWRPHFNFQELGIMIDNNMSVDIILNLPSQMPFSYVRALYPDIVKP